MPSFLLFRIFKLQPIVLLRTYLALPEGELARRQP